jgi:N-acetylmuramoyl-L-alanine amidase
VTSPAVLIEGGFITNQDELSKLASEGYRDQLAAAVADGILRYRDMVGQRKSAVAATGQKSAE